MKLKDESLLIFEPFSWLIPGRQIKYHIGIQQQYKYKYKHIIQDIRQVLKFWSSYFSFYCKLRILRNIIEHLSLRQIL